MRLLPLHAYCINVTRPFICVFLLYTGVYLYLHFRPRTVGPGTAYHIHGECLSHDTTYFRISARMIESICCDVARTFGLKVKRSLLGPLLAEIRISSVPLYALFPIRLLLYVLPPIRPFSMYAPSGGER